MHLLIIEDDLDLGSAIQRALKAEGLTSEWLRSAAQAPCLAADINMDCILLDLTLPDGTGLTLLKQWREAGITIPIIIMTARTELNDRLQGLDDGADDFMVKPFAIPELVSRIRAVTRRYAQQSRDEWVIGDLTIWPRRYITQLSGTPIDLSPREFHLLLELAREPGRVVSKGILAQRLEPLGDAVDFGAIEVHISNLRRKIGAQRIRTVRGVGYMLAV